jgi:hypothetical protein
MNNDTLVEIRARLHRLERQNRILIIGLCAIVGVASIAATNHSASIVTAAEVRTPRLTMVDNHGKICLKRGASTTILISKTTLVQLATLGSGDWVSL